MFLIIFFLGFIKCQKLTYVNFNNNTNQWSSNDQGSINNTYLIHTLEQFIYYAQIKIDSQIIDFHLFGKSGSPPQFIYETDNADFLGYIEKSDIRFLKIVATNFSIYFTTTTLKDVNYEIIITRTKSSIICSTCQNFQNCLINGCNCTIGYIGRNCSIQANQLVNQESFSYTQDYYATIFNQYYINKGDDNVIFQINTNSEIEVEIVLQLSLDTYFPDTNDSNLTQQFLTRYFVNNNNQLNISYSIQETKDIQSIIFLSKLINNETNVLITIKTNTHSENSSLILILCLVFGLTGMTILLLIFIFCVIRYTIKRRQEQEKRRQSISNSLQDIPNFNLFYIQQPYKKTEIDFYLNQYQIYKVNQIISDNCTICLEQLNHNKIYQTICQHQFHEQCIFLWLQKQRQCPNCRILISKIDQNQ